jgi:methionine-rich copper-binding protein CopC
MAAIVSLPFGARGSGDTGTCWLNKIRARSAPGQQEVPMSAAVASRPGGLRFFVRLSLAMFSFLPCVASARPLHVRESRPVANAFIQGRHAEYVIRFDGPVDHSASRMRIIQSGQVIQMLTPRADSAVDVLFADGIAPPPGRYLLHWEVSSIDGETTSGDIPFNVRP